MDVVGMVQRKEQKGAGMKLPLGFGANLLKRAPLAPEVASNIVGILVLVGVTMALVEGQATPQSCLTP